MSQHYQCVECGLMFRGWSPPEGWERVEVSIRFAGNTYERKGLACRKCGEAVERIATSGARAEEGA